MASTGVQSSVTVTKPQGIIHSLFVAENQCPLWREAVIALNNDTISSQSALSY